MFILGSFWDKVGGAILDAIRSLMLSLCDIIYKLIVFFFDIFMKLANADLLQDEAVQKIYTRIGLILGIFMIFRVIFSLIQYIINPDLMFDKKKGLVDIVKKIFIVVVLLGTTPALFKYAYKLQEMVVTSNIIPRIITGQNVGTGEHGETLAWYSFSSFYKFNDISELNSITVRGKCPELNGDNSLIRRDFKENHSLRYAYNCVNTPVTYNKENKDTGVIETYQTYAIEFTGNGLIPFVVGCFILWMVVMYVIQVGVRVIQLAYLQLISPVPIIMYLTPKGDDYLNKWFKQCVTTYVDLFIRIAIIYLVIFIIDLLVNVDTGHFFDTLGNVTPVDLSFIVVIMIIALLIFAQKVPKLLAEVFPALGGGAAGFSFGLNPKKEFNNTLVAGAFGAVGGAIGAGTSNAIHGYMNMRNAWKKNSNIIPKLTEDQTKKMGEEAVKEYNLKRREQLAARRKAVGFAAGKGVFSVVGGVAGGAKAGMKTKDITKVGDVVKTTNANREKRELKANAGYHWYRPDKVVEDKILGFAGETTKAEKQIKVADFRKDALQQTKSFSWEDFAKKNPGEDLSLLRSMQEFEEGGRRVWKGINSRGEEQTYILTGEGDSTIFVNANNDEDFIDVDGTNIVLKSASLDKQIKEQNKIIKGLQSADGDAKK